MKVTISKKLFIGFGVLLTLMFGLGWLAIHKMDVINQQSSVMAENWMPSIRYAEEINRGTSDYRIAELTHVVSEKPEEMAAAEKTMDEVMAEIKRDRADYEKLISSPEEKALYDEFSRQYDEYLAVHDKMIPLSRQLKTKEAMLLMNGESKRLFDESSANLLKIVALNVKGGDDASAEGDLIFAKANKVVMGLIALAILLGIGVAFYIVRDLKRQLGGEPKDAAQVANEVAMGDFSTPIQIQSGDNSSLMYALDKMRQTIQSLMKDTQKVSVAAVNGQLKERADAGQYQGEFKELVEGFNKTVDALVTPLNNTAEYMKRISTGDIPPRINEEYKGDYNTIKNSVNICIDAINTLVSDANQLAESAVAGDLSKRADASRHQGDFRKVVQGVNDTLDAVITPLNVAASYVDSIAKGHIPNKITDTYNGDFNTLKNNLNQCIDAVNALVADAGMLADAAKNGLLSTRADATKHQGDFRKVVDGVNKTLDDVIGPLNVAADCVDRISKGDIPSKITDTYHGDFNAIKNNLNQCIDAVNLLVQDANMLADAAADGRVTTRADANKHQGDFRKVVEGVNATLETIVAPIVAVKMAAETINTAAGEISTGNNDLSSRTEEQASSLEETASSMEELASTVKQNAENAKQANQLATAASGVAIKGGEVVNEVVTTMSAINESAKKIEDIISVIDGIAFQTNILALNAAVEAARAGEQGRGFAVVAGEVRNLAQRSASAAKEIKELITDSVSKTAEGTRQVEMAGSTMQEIVSSVQRVTDIMGEISAASSEQSAGIDQVNMAITSMDEVTQQNAALVEEAAAAAESLVEQAASLMDTVNAFKLQDGASNDRRTTDSPMRTSSRTPNRPAVSVSTKQVTAKVLAKTGTDDGDWEAF